jgi:hypothetical protein
MLHPLEKTTRKITVSEKNASLLVTVLKGWVLLLSKTWLVKYVIYVCGKSILIFEKIK